jgi:hypothetical protein
VLTLNWCTIFSFRLYVSGHLLDLDDHELRRLQGCETEDDVHNAPVYIVVGDGRFVALDGVRLPQGPALEGALAEKRLHEVADVEADLGQRGSSLDSKTTHCVSL